MKMIQEYLKEQLYQDLCYKCGQINEVGGLYDGQIELASYIMDDIEKNINKKSIKLKYSNKDFTFSNIYFNNLNVNIEFWNNKFVEANSIIFSNLEENDLYKRYNYDKKNNRLNNIIINISCPNDLIKYYDDIRGRISHELNHGYTYFEIIEDDFKEPNIVPEEYHNKLHEWKDQIYNKISNKLKNPPLKDAERFSYYLIYTLTRYERNAFLSEILSYLFDKNSSFSKAEEIQSKLNKSQQYKLYINETPIILNEIKTNWNKENQQIFKETYNKVYNTNKSFNKIIKLFEFKLEETIKKINKNISKLSKRYINRIILKENVFYDPPYEEISFLHNPYIIEWF